MQRELKQSREYRERLTAYGLIKPSLRLPPCEREALPAKDVQHLALASTL